MTEPAPQLPPRPRRLSHRRIRGAAKPPLRITERDRAILKAVWQNRFLTRALLTQLFPPESGDLTSEHTHLARRLEALYDHDYLDRLRRQPGPELVYALGLRGAAELRAAHLPVVETNWTKKNASVKAFYAEHALIVARLRVALLLAVRERPSLTLERFEREHAGLTAEWRQRGERLFVNPDALFVIHDAERRDGGQRYAYVVEADRSTMTHERVLAKYWAYVQCYLGGHHARLGVENFWVLTITKSAERASNLQKAAALRVPPEHHARFLFTTEEAYRAHATNVLAPIWRSLRDDARDDDGQPPQRRFLTSSPLPRR